MQLKDICLILGLFYCILTLTLLGRKPVITKNYAIFGVKLVCLKFGLCKENYILHIYFVYSKEVVCTLPKIYNSTLQLSTVL